MLDSAKEIRRMKIWNKECKRFSLFLIDSSSSSSQQSHLHYTYILLIMTSKTYYELQKRFDRVTNNYKQDHYFTVIVVAIVYQMNRRVLFNRIRKCHFKFTRFVSNKRLNDVQKQVLLTYITKNDDVNMFLIFALIMKVSITFFENWIQSSNQSMFLDINVSKIAIFNWNCVVKNSSTWREKTPSIWRTCNVTLTNCHKYATNTKFRT